MINTLINFIYLTCEYLNFLIFKQTIGIAMGTNCTLDFANIFLLFYEYHTVFNFPYFRYLDDIILFTPHLIFLITFTPNLPLNILLDYYNNNHYTNETLLEIPPQQLLIPYLDLQFLHVFVGSPAFCIYVKPLNLYQYIQPSSYVLTSIHKGLIIEETI